MHALNQSQRTTYQQPPLHVPRTYHVRTDSSFLCACVLRRIGEPTSALRRILTVLTPAWGAFAVHTRI
jgi:hypothetical protein